MKTIINKTRKPLRIRLPGGKTLFLGGTREAKLRDEARDMTQPLSAGRPTARIARIARARMDRIRMFLLDGMAWCEASRLAARV